MSKLIDRLKKASPVASTPMGFRAAPAAPPPPKMLLIASLAQADFDGAADRMAGADAGLIPVFKLASGAKAIREVSRAVPGIPWGGWLKAPGIAEITPLVEAGGDYVVFPAAGAVLPAPQGEAPGRILEVDISLDEGLLRAVDRLPVDAVLSGGEPPEGDFLTWHHLMRLQRCAGLLSKPLLAPVPSGVSAAQLQILLDAGVDGVVVAVEPGQPAGRLEELRQAIAGLSLPSPHQRKPAALLPHIGGDVEEAAEEPEED